MRDELVPQTTKPEIAGKIDILMMSLSDLLDKSDKLTERLRPVSIPDDQRLEGTVRGETASPTGSPLGQELSEAIRRIEIIGHRLDEARHALCI